MNKRRFISRRDFLFEAGTGISGLALLALLKQDGLLAQSTFASPTLLLASRGVETSSEWKNAVADAQLAAGAVQVL